MTVDDVGATSDDLADALVEHFNELEEVPIEFEAQKPEEEIVLDPKVQEWKVYVWPAGESEEAIDRGDMCREELQVEVYIHGPIGEQFTKKKAIEFVKFLRKSLRETQFENFRWDSNELVDGVFDTGVLKLKKHFLTVFRATYFNFA